MPFKARNGAGCPLAIGNVQRGLWLVQNANYFVVVVSCCQEFITKRRSIQKMNVPEMDGLRIQVRAPRTNLPMNPYTMDVRWALIKIIFRAYWHIVSTLAILSGESRIKRGSNSLVALMKNYLVPMLISWKHPRRLVSTSFQRGLITSNLLKFQIWI